jgi:hypothetical protein
MFLELQVSGLPGADFGAGFFGDLWRGIKRWFSKNKGKLARGASRAIASLLGQPSFNKTKGQITELFRTLPTQVLARIEAKLPAEVQKFIVAPIREQVAAEKRLAVGTVQAATAVPRITGSGGGPVLRPRRKRSGDELFAMSRPKRLRLAQRPFLAERRRLALGRGFDRGGLSNLAGGGGLEGRGAYYGGEYGMRGGGLIDEDMDF